MSYSLVPYIVDVNKVKKLVGCKDEKILATLLKRAECENDEEPQAPVSRARVHEDDEDDDDEDDDVDDDDDDEEEIGMKKAIRDLIMGRPLVESAGHEYGYALEQICKAAGTEPASDAWCGIRWEVLEASGADVLLLTSGSPVVLPEIDDFPTIGHLTAEQVTAALAECAGGVKTLAPKGKKIKKTLLQRILGPLLVMIVNRMIGRNRGPITQADLQESYAEYLSWLQAAQAKKVGIVFFYY